MSSVVTFLMSQILSFFFFFNDTATTEIYTLSLHDALPIWPCSPRWELANGGISRSSATADRKSTRLNSSHDQISYAVFCLKKKTKNEHRQRQAAIARGFLTYSFSTTRAPHRAFLAPSSSTPHAVGDVRFCSFFFF